MNAKPDRNAWVKGGDARCDMLQQTQAYPRRLVLLGAPGVGKGTQAELLTERLGVCHLSTGDIFRNAKKLPAPEISPAMRCALDCMRAGKLVTDDIVLSVVAERADCLRCGGGFLLDGFPRTLVQTKALTGILAARGLALDAVLSYELPLETIIARLSGRRTCAKCQAVYHIESRRPQFEGICDQCGADLVQREDDRPEAVHVRMGAYLQSTAPLIDFYQEQGLLVSIDAHGTPEEIYQRTINALSDRCVARQS